MVMMILYMDTMFRQLRGIGNVFKRITSLIEEGKEYLELMMTPHEVLDHPDARDIQIADSEIRFEDVHFGYTRYEGSEISDTFRASDLHTSELSEDSVNTQQFKNFSLTIGSGEHV